jgi:hypothetical protein
MATTMDRFQTRHRVRRVKGTSVPPLPVCAGSAALPVAAAPAEGIVASIVGRSFAVGPAPRTRVLDAAGRLSDDRIAGVLGWTSGTRLDVTFDAAGSRATFSVAAGAGAETNRRPHVGSKGLVVSLGIRSRLGLGDRAEVAVWVDGDAGTLTVAAAGFLSAAVEAFDRVGPLEAEVAAGADRIAELERLVAYLTATIPAADLSPAG